MKDTEDLPPYVKDALTLVPVNSLEQVIARSLLPSELADKAAIPEPNEVAS